MRDTGDFITLHGEFHRVTLSQNCTLGENLLAASRISTFSDMPEHSLLSMGDFALLCPRDIAWIESSINPRLPSFVAGYLGLVPSVLMILESIDEKMCLGENEMLIDLSQWTTKDRNKSAALKTLTVLCTIANGGWLLETETNVSIISPSNKSSI